MSPFADSVRRMEQKDNGGGVVIAGQGYVGLPLAMAAVGAGYRVLGIDLDRRRVSDISSGQSPVSDVPSAQLVRSLEAGSYSVTDDYAQGAGFAIAVITVPTPLHDGKPDLTFIESAADSLAGLISHGCLIILESTTYPGTTEELLVPILEQKSALIAGKDFLVGYSPERIDPGNRKWNLLNTPKVVSGINAQSLTAVRDFYSSLGIPTVEVSGTREAELTKLLENTFRHVNIALVNELAVFSGSLGVDIWESIEAASTKPFGYMKFTPGPGVGGHCLPVDPSYLSWAIQEKSGESFRFVELANRINSYMPNYIVSRAIKILENELGTEQKKILLVGLSYKPDTSDIRESPSLVVADLLCSLGFEVSGIDHLVRDYEWPTNVRVVSDLDSEKFDLGILLTHHSDGHGSSALGACEVILDTRKVLKGANVKYL